MKWIDELGKQVQNKKGREVTIYTAKNPGESTATWTKDWRARTRGCHSPPVPQVVPIDGNRLRDIIGRCAAIGAPQQHIRHKLTANYGDIRRKVNPQYAQHAFLHSKDDDNDNTSPRPQVSSSSSEKDSCAEPATQPDPTTLLRVGRKPGWSAITCPGGTPGFTNSIWTPTDIEKKDNLPVTQTTGKARRIGGVQ